MTMHLQKLERSANGKSTFWSICRMCSRKMPRRHYLRTLLICLLGTMGSSAAAELRDNAFGQYFTKAASIGDDQAQVIYYRAADKDAAGAANVYLDQEFVTALQPGGFTQFCVAPGKHTLGAYLDDAPDYAGKTHELYAAAFRSGATYYLKVREEGLNRPVAVSRDMADAELRVLREQIHLVSRASQAEKCRYFHFLDHPESAVRDFVLLADSAFNALGGLSDEGRRAVTAVLDDLQMETAQIVRVEVEGHTDPLGVSADNQMRGQRWADAVRMALIERGVPESVITASSSGSRVPVNRSCSGNLREQRTCYAPNRRIAIQVELRGDGTSR